MAQHVPAEDKSSKEDEIYCETLTLQKKKKERINAVRGYYNGSFITGLEVETTLKNKLQAGVEEGEEIDFYLPPNKHLGGFTGAFGDQLHKLGLVLYNER